ncbi:Bax inhibitor-1/YccA family protein, partial [Elusimicrobiota bacterium]
MRSANPALKANTFASYRNMAHGSDAMTIQGTVNKTGFLLLLTILSASYTWNIFFTSGMQAVTPWLYGGMIGGLVFALITVFAKRYAAITAPIYALLKGLMLGGISAYAEKYYPGVPMQAVALTFGTLFCLLMAYKSGLIKPTENFKLGIASATGAIFMIYMLNFILSFFGIRVPFIHESGIIGIGFSLFVVVIAALNLVLDFDFIEQGAEAGVPKFMEWFAAFGLLVTLIWLYLEFLRLLMKL